MSSIPEAVQVNGYSYIYAGGLPTEQIGPNGSVLYYLEDRQGSTVALTDSSGQVVVRYSYSPYGSLICGPNTPPNTQPNQPPCHPAPPTPPAACPPPSQHSPAGHPPCLSKAIAANHFLYDGQYLDTISGLYYLRARWYDPATGQFTSVDALVALTGHPYSYASGNPVNGGDPGGLTSEGYCVVLSGSVFLASGSFQFCIVELNGNKQVGITVTAAGGSQTNSAQILNTLKSPASVKKLFSVTANVAYQRTNANKLSQLSSWFSYDTFSLGIGPISGEYTYFSSECIQGVHGAEIGLGVGWSGIPSPVSAGNSIGESWTWTHQLTGSAASLVAGIITALNYANPLHWTGLPGG